VWPDRFGETHPPMHIELGDGVEWNCSICMCVCGDVRVRAVTSSIHSAGRGADRGWAGEQAPVRARRDCPPRAPLQSKSKRGATGRRTRAIESRVRACVRPAAPSRTRAAAFAGGVATHVRH
jgi:hypothetical protein